MEKKKTRAEQAEQTKAAVFDAAEALISQNGYSNVTIRAICGQAGVSVGTFYRYFSDKTDILKAMHDAAHHAVTDYDYTGLCSTALDAIHCYFTLYAQTVEADGADRYWAINNIDREWLTQDTSFFDTLSSLVLWGQMSKQLTEEMSVNEITTFLLVSLRGVTHDWAYHNGNYSLVSYVSAYTTRLMKAFIIKP